LVRRHGDILAIYTWVNDERALVLMPARRAQGAPWFIVCESAAYKYDDASYLARQASQAARVLGMDETTSTWYRIANIIIEGLPDLIRMPTAPIPELQRHAIGEMKLMADGKLVTGQEIREEKTGLEYA
jgi:hypothetical protein